MDSGGLATERCLQHAVGVAGCGCRRLTSTFGEERAVQQRDAADEGRLEVSGSIVVGSLIVYEGTVVRPSQLIASVGPT